LHPFPYTKKVTYAEAEQLIRAGIARRPLPGLAAQIRLAPRPRPNWHPGEIPKAATPAGVLVLLFDGADGASVVLTVRSTDLPAHPGQVSFPGGRVEPGETIVETALRESHEEIGLRREEVEVLGRLSPLHIPVSGFALHPIVGIQRGRPALTPETGEVAKILEVPLAYLRDPSCLGVRSRTRDGFQDEVPYFELAGGEQVWGATAMVLAELLDLVGYRANPWVGR
jgi:8-oxo-dGTP pyrophosphatase MutT (NUDIX family)